MSERAAKRLAISALPFAHPPVAFLRLACPAVLARCYPPLRIDALPTALVALVFAFSDVLSHCAFAGTSRLHRGVARLPTASLASVRLFKIPDARASLIHLLPRSINWVGMLLVRQLAFIAQIRSIRTLTADFRHLFPVNFLALSALDALSTVRSIHELGPTQVGGLMVACPGLRSLGITCALAGLEHLSASLTELDIRVVDYALLSDTADAAPAAVHDAWRRLLGLTKLQKLTFQHALLAWQVDDLCVAMPHLASLICHTMHGAQRPFNFQRLAELECLGLYDVDHIFTGPVCATLKKLQVVRLGASNADSSGLVRELRHMRQLQELRLRNANYTDTFLRELCVPADDSADPPTLLPRLALFHSLTSLHVWGADWDLRGLAAFTSLTELDYHRLYTESPLAQSLDAVHALNLPRLPLLARLTLTGAARFYSHTNLSPLFPALERASLSCNMSTGCRADLGMLQARVVQVVRRLSSVRSVDVSEWAFGAAAAERLLCAGHCMKQLTTLIVSKEAALDAELVSFLGGRGIAMSIASL